MIHRPFYLYRFTLFLFVQLILVSECTSQTETTSEKQAAPSKGRLAITAGAGNYEYLHVGLHASLKRSYYFETAAGTKPWGFDERYIMGYVCLGGYLLKEKPWKLKPSLHLKLLCWDLDNVNNHFLVLAINPEIRISYPLKGRFQLCGNIGGLYNTMLYYKRKTYEEVGWPKEWQPSFSIQLVYRIK